MRGDRPNPMTARTRRPGRARGPRARKNPVYYHGGRPGLASIEPPSVTGAVPLLSYGDWRRYAYPAWRVYVTTEKSLAEMSAALWAVRRGQPEGWVYKVRPGADLDADLDEPGAYSCDSAQVISVAGTVPAARLPAALDAWTGRRPAVPDARPRTGAEMLAYFERMACRAVRHGHDEGAVRAALDEAACRAGERARAVGTPARHEDGPAG